MKDNTKESIEQYNQDPSGKLSGIIIGQRGIDCRYTLNPKPTKHIYEYTGTATALMHGTRQPIKINGKVASTPLYINRPKDGQSITQIIEKELKRAAFVLENKCSEQARGDSRKNLLLSDMSLSEALTMYLMSASQNRSRMDNVRGDYKSRLERISNQLGGTLIGKINRKTLSQALPAKSDKTKAVYLSELRHFVSFAEDQQRCECGLCAVIEEVYSQLKLKDPAKTEAAAAKEASNGKTLPDEAEGWLNNQIEQNMRNPLFVALALAKGGGLSNADICALKIGDIHISSNREVTFVHLTKNYVSATQDYTFPLFPWESCLIHKYLQMLKKEYGGERLKEDRYLLSSTADGLEAIETKEITELCRLELQKLRIGYANLIGDADLSRDKSITMLHATYRARLEACGISQDYDKGAWLFMQHRSLGNNTQADHYRSFSAETGRQCLLDYVMHDHRFIHRRFSSYLQHAGEGPFTLLPEDDNAHQATVEFDLNPDDVATIRTQTGAYFEIISVERIAETQNQMIREENSE